MVVSARCCDTPAARQLASCNAWTPTPFKDPVNASAGSSPGCSMQNFRDCKCVLRAKLWDENHLILKNNCLCCECDGSKMCKLADGNIFGQKRSEVVKKRSLHPSRFPTMHCHIACNKGEQLVLRDQFAKTNEKDIFGTFSPDIHIAQSSAAVDHLLVCL